MQWAAHFPHFQGVQSRVPKPSKQMTTFRDSEGVPDLAVDILLLLPHVLDITVDLVIFLVGWVGES